jgi:membrane protease YdiL (CAAX protease family)
MLSDTSKTKLKRPKVEPKEGSFGGPLRVVLTTIAAFVLSQIIAAVLAELMLAAAGADRSLTDSNAAEFIFVLLAEFLAAGLVYLVLKEQRLKLSSIGLGRRPQWRDLRRALLAFLAFYGILILVGIVVNIFVPSITNETQDVGFNTLSTFSDSALAFVALVILPPLGEETLVRGYLYSGLRSRWRFWPALILTSALFGAAHLSGTDSGLLWSGALDTFVLSAVLVYLRETTGALYAGMLVHSLNNVVAFGIHFHGVLF